MVLVDVGEDNVDNLALTALAGDQMQAVTGLSSRYHAGVTRFSERESEATALQLYVGDAALPDAPVPTIAPYQTIKAPIDVTFSQEGSATLTAELPGDRLDADNTRALAVPVARALKVLIVNGEPSADPYLDEVFLLRVALRPEGPQFSGNDLVVIDETEFEQTDPSGFHVVLLANVYRITEAIAEDFQRAKRGKVRKFTSGYCMATVQASGRSGCGKWCLLRIAAGFRLARRTRHTLSLRGSPGRLRCTLTACA